MLGGLARVVAPKLFKLHMRVQYGLYVRARLQDLGMDRQLDRLRAITFQHRAVDDRATPELFSGRLQIIEFA